MTTSLTVKNKSIRPFLKWVGGKRQLLGEIMPLVPEAMNGATYFEPFMGGGAVFWTMARERPSAFSRYVLSDVNTDLIGCNQAVRDNVEQTMRYVRSHQEKHSKPYYYQVRGLGRDLSWMNKYALAARMIYLNKSGHSGLWRVNKAGQMNVPWGNYTRPAIDADTIRACSATLRRLDTTVTASSYTAVLQTAVSGDFVYLDPPYLPVKDQSFTAYTKTGFSLEDHQRLTAVCHDLTQRGVRFLLSNADVPMADELYAGFTIDRVLARRSVNIKANGRGKVGEVLVRNY